MKPEKSYDESEMLQLLQHMDSRCMGEGWTESVMLRMQSRLMFVAECLAEAPPGQPVGQFGELLVLGEEGHPSRWVPVNGVLMIGCQADCGVPLAGDGVSRNHASITPRPGGGVTIQDLESTNGTFVNGYKVSSASLADGDILTFGSSHVIYLKRIGDAD